MKDKFCWESGISFCGSLRTKYYRLRDEVMPVTYRQAAKYSEDGKPHSLTVERSVTVITCPECGRTLRARKHPFSTLYWMVPRHKKP